MFIIRTSFVLLCGEELHILFGGLGTTNLWSLPGRHRYQIDPRQADGG
jgi:hypothetical protein